MKNKKTLYLTLKRKWFDMIASGEKREEYREVKRYWNDRLMKDYDEVVFRNGYIKGCPELKAEIKSIGLGIGKEEWGAPNEVVYIISLGKIKSIKY